ncbi:uncharacterized protein V6R79_017635 [Siganus canaliculatus]
MAAVHYSCAAPWKEEEEEEEEKEKEEEDEEEEESPRRNSNKTFINKNQRTRNRTGTRGPEPADRNQQTRTSRPETGLEKSLGLLRRRGLVPVRHWNSRRQSGRSRRRLDCSLGPFLVLGTWSPRGPGQRLAQRQRGFSPPAAVTTMKPSSRHSSFLTLHEPRVLRAGSGLCCCWSPSGLALVWLWSGSVLGSDGRPDQSPDQSQTRAQTRNAAGNKGLTEMSSV